MARIRIESFKQDLSRDKFIKHFGVATTARWAASLLDDNFKIATHYFRGLRELLAHHTEQAATVASSCEIEVRDML